jgi:hypothetical protein
MILKKNRPSSDTAIAAHLTGDYTNDDPGASPGQLSCGL